MATDRFYIGPYDSNSGLQTNYKPFVIPEQAFSELNNAYVFRGRVRKRFGSRWLGESQLTTRFRAQIGTTDGGTGNFAGFVPLDSAGTPIATPAIGQMFSIGTEVFTVTALGNPANLLRSDGIAAAATFDTTTGAVTINTNGAQLGVAVYYYPSLPVMGLLTFEGTSVNDEPVIGFDTRFAYQYNGGWERLDAEVDVGAASWRGDDSQFFWANTWTGTSAADKVFFVTNFNENEYVAVTHPVNMRYLFNNQWNNFRPAISATEFLNAARIIVTFKNRLVMFNTWEGVDPVGTNYPNRCRYSQVGDPLDASAWRQDLPGRGNAIDCPTTEAIITVEFVKDQLVVFAERSTWALVYTGNQAYPFTWQQINTELGAESTNSIIPLDTVAVGVGQVGIMACNGANVERIDSLIPSAVFDIHNVDGGVKRVYGIRDYYVEMLYFAMPDTDSSADFPYPNKVLVYNYKTATWSFNDDSITAFGYFQPVSGVTWSSTQVTWNDDVAWDSGAVSAKFRNVIAGNQEGYTFIVDPDVTTNAPALQITDIAVVNNIVTITAINHNLREGDYVYLQDIVDLVGNLTLLNDAIFEVIDSGANPLTANTFSFVYDGVAVLAGTYVGNGVLARVSNIVIQTKEYNFYARQGRNTYLSKVDFLVDSTPEGQIQVDYFVSSAMTPLLEESSGTGTLLGTGALDTFPYPTVPFEANAQRLWHPVYLTADGEYVQLRLTMNDEQMRDTDVRKCDFQLHAMILHASPSSSRLQ